MTDREVLEVPDGALVVLRSTTPDEALEFAENLADRLADRHVVVAVLDHDESIEVLPADRMREFGWERWCDR